MERILKSNPMMAVLRAVDYEISRLDGIHCGGVAYGAKEPFYSNIQKQVTLLEEGKKQIGLIFESQFTKK